MSDPLMCPKCRVEPMAAESYAGVEIDRCPVCKGMFFDMGELRQLVTASAATAADTLAFSAVSDVMDTVAAHCPRCDQPMLAHTGGELRIDRCPGCNAIFLDQGELATLQLQHS